MPCSSHSQSIVGCGPCIQVDQRGGWYPARNPGAPPQPYVSPLGPDYQGGLERNCEHPPPIDLGGKGAGRALAEGVAACLLLRHMFPRDPEVKAGNGFVLGVIVAIALFVLWANWAINRGEAAKVEYGKCIDRVTVVDDGGNYTPESVKAQDACYQQLLANGG